MSRVLVSKSMSLDGYVAGPNVSHEYPMGEGGESLHEWMFADPVAAPDRELIARLRERVGGTVVGRRTFDLGLPHWSDVPWPGPSFVLTHRPRSPSPQDSGTFTFVSDLVEAVERGREATGDKDLLLMGAEVCRQALAAGLVDELLLSVVPITLGGGARPFGDVAGLPLRPTGTTVSPAVAHLHYDVVR